MKKIIKWTAALFAVAVLASMFFYVREKKSRGGFFSNPFSFNVVPPESLRAEARRKITLEHDYPAAVRLARKALQASPEDADIQITLGRAFLLNGNFDSAGFYLEQAIVKEPENTDALSYLTTISLHKPDTAAALTWIAQSLQYQPEERDLRLKQYGLLLNSGRLHASDSIYKIYTKRFKPDSIRQVSFEYWQAKASDDEKSGRTAAAYASLRQAIRYQPNDTSALRRLAGISFLYGEYSLAEKYNNSLLKQQPRNQPALLRAADIRQAQRDTAGALEYAVRAYHVSASRETKQYLAALYISLARDAAPGEKVRYASEALALDPGSREALNYRINGYIEAHEYEQALKATEAALRSYPDEQVFIDKKTGILYDQGDFRACAAWLESVLRRYPQRHNVRNYEDVILTLVAQDIRQGRLEPAIVDARKGLAYQPANKLLKEQLVNAYSGLMRYDEALTVTNELLAATPSDETWQFKKAGLLEKLGRFGEAAAITGSLYSKRPSDTLYRNAYLDELLAIQRQYLAAGDWDRSLDVYRASAAVPQPRPGYYSMLYGIAAWLGKKEPQPALSLTDSALYWYPRDSMLSVKRSEELASLKRFPEALASSRGLYEEFPHDTGLQVMYLNQLDAAGKYYMLKDTLAIADSAIGSFLAAHSFAPKDTFAIMNLSAIYFVKRRFDSSIYYADLGLQIDSNNVYLLNKKAASYEQTMQYKQAYVAAKRAFELAPSKGSAEYADYLHGKSYRNQLMVSHLQSFFAGSSLYADVTTIQYMRRFNKGSVSGSISYGDRPPGSSIQLGVDAYYNHNKSNYSNAFLYGSSGRAFPYWIGGYSLFHNFSHGWESEIGARYLGFDSINNYSAVIGGGKYLGNTWINLRAFYTYNTNEWFQSYLLTGRQYLNDKKDYITAIFGLGSIPDDQSLQFNFNKFSGFVSQSAGIGFTKNFRYRYSLQALINYTNLKVGPDRRLDQYDLYITLSRNF